MRATPPLLRGAKGGSTPIEESDTLRSTQRAEIVDLLGEGLIGGLVNGLKSVYLDGVPVENADGSRNFAEFAHTITLGGPTGEKPHAFGDVQTEVGVGITVLAAVPVVRSIGDATADAVRVTITVPTLMKQQDNGDRTGTSVEFAIDVQSNGGGYVERHHDVISGKATSPYSRAVKIDLKALGPPPWDVRVRRITPDSASLNLVNAFAWSSYTVISGVRMLYRHSAAMALTFDAKGFSAVPQRWYDMMGVSDWDIPVNYDPLARTLAGAWNGTFKQGWTNNPAWVLYNLVQQPRYGLGHYVQQLPDKWTLYQLAQWCDVQLPDGRGGTEPRYTINAWLVEQVEAVRLLQDICAVFRGALLYTGVTLGATWDAPAEPAAAFTPANVVDGTFTYTDGSRGNKKSSCTCWYTDRSQAGRRMPATWDDPDLVAKYGVRSMEINPIGVATPAQALRMAKWALYTNELEDQTVVFRAGMQGVVLRLGDVFQVSDPSETGERLGGRVRAAAASELTLDAEVTLAAGETYTLWVTQPDPADPQKLVLEQRAVTTAAGVTQVLQVAAPFSSVPLAGTIWVLEGTDVVPTLWRCVAITEVPATDADGTQYEVTGVRHLPGKWGLVEYDQPLTVRPTRRLPDAAPPVSSVGITETVYWDADVARIRVTVSWPLPAAGLRYVMAWRMDNGPWTNLPPTGANTVDVDGLQPGLFEAQVQSLNALGQFSLPTSSTLQLTGDDAPPSNVSALTWLIKPGQVQISWAKPPDIDYRSTELRTGATWATAAFVWAGSATEYQHPRPPNGTYRVWAAHIDRKGQYSAVPQSIDVTVDDSIDAAGGSTVYSLLTSAGAVVKNQAGAFTPPTLTIEARSQSGASPVAPYAGRFTIELSTNGSTYGAPVYQSGTNEPSTVYTVSGATTKLIRVRLYKAGGFAELADEEVIPIVVDGAPGQSGVDGLTVVVKNRAHNLPADANGNVLNYTGSGTEIQVWEGSTLLTFNFALGASVWTMGTPTVTPGGAISVGARSGQGSTTAVVAQHSGASAAQDVVQITYPLTVRRANGQDVAISAFQTLTKAKQGTQGNTGGTGATGKSVRVAYAIYTGNPVVSGGEVVTFGASSLPASFAWSPSAVTSFTAQPQQPGTGQSTLMTQGVYDPATDQTTWQVPFLANFRVGNLAALSAVVDGSLPASVYDAFSGSFLSRTAALAANTSNGAQIGMLAQSNTALMPAVQGQHLGSTGYGVLGHGAIGVFGHGTSGGVGVEGDADGVGSIAVKGTSDGNGSYGGYFQTSGVGGGASNIALYARAASANHTALYVDGASTHAGRLTLTSANPPLVLPVVSSKPPAVLGGVALHSTNGLIVSDGVNWFAAAPPASIYVLP